MQKTIAIIEDNVPLNRLLQLKLKRLGYDIVSFENGKTAFDYLIHHPVDLIILDIMLYGMTGWEIINDMKNYETFRDTPIIVLSIRSREEDMKRTFKATNVIEYIAKPFKVSRLTHAIEKHFTTIVPE